MGPIRLFTAPIRRIANSRLVQLAVVVTIILLLDHYSYDYAPLLPITEGLKKSVTATVDLFSKYFRVGILTDPVLQVGLMIAYVYIICLLIFILLRRAVRGLVDVVGANNFLWLRSTIARERGIAAYRAWEPLERIRPADCPQEQWEQQFAWPADNKPPYPPWPRRLLHGVISYVVVFVGIAILLQVFTPFPVLTWLGHLFNAPTG
jgi:small-conductance mechanosensitive channel